LSFASEIISILQQIALPILLKQALETRKDRQNSVMATAVLDHQVIPGLHVAPYLLNLSRSSEVYNHLPDDADQPHVAEEHLKNLAGIFL
ncbi:hypothetical protein AOQ84DRAFT_426869, partial [Glonium stellatum]